MADFQQDPNSALGQVQKLLSMSGYDPAERAQNKQVRDQAQANYSGVLNESLPDIGPVQRMVSEYLTRYSQNPRQPFAALAGAAGSEAPAGQMMSFEQLKRRQQAKAEELKMADSNLKESDLYGKTALSLLAKSGRGASPTVKMDKDGNMVVYDPLTQDTRVVHASQRGEYQRLWTSAYQKAVSNEMEDPEGYAHEVASRVLSSSPGFNPQVSPIPSASSSRPPIQPTLQPPQPQSPPPPGMLPPTSPEQNSSRNIQLLQAELKRPENQTPDKQLVLKQELEREMGANPQPTPAPTPAPQAPRTMEYIDPRTRKQNEGYGQKEGEGLYKERQALTDLHGANSKLMGQLDMLERIYADPNIPQGELANIQQSIRSGLVTLGVPGAQEVGVSDFARALGTSLSLTQKNADGQNLLPGAMSNYEDQLLQKMAPTLSLTNEGRLMLVKFMKQVAQSNLRIAQEGTQMASANKNQLPANWYERKERVMREEMAKLRLLSQSMLQGAEK